MVTGFSFYQLFEESVNKWEPAESTFLPGGIVPLRIEKRLAFSPKVVDTVLSAGCLDQFYFSDRHNRYETGAIGCARAFTADNAGEIENLWKKNPLFRLFGGMSFFDDNMPLEWRSFGRFRFVLPLIEISRDSNGTRIVLNGIPGKDTPHYDVKGDILRQLRRLDAAEKPVSSFEIPSYCETRLPEYGHWQTIVAEALAWLNENGVRKVVLARKKIMTSDVLWDPIVLFKGIEKIKEDSFLFFCRQQNSDAFFGRSPERLFKLSKGTLSSDAIAGTRKRSDFPGDDDRLASELMASAKDVEEHRIVVDYIQKLMAGLCEDLAVDASRTPLKLKHLQHIITRVSGRVRNGHRPESMMRCLHPTPAVGGVPPQASGEMIMRLEPFKRGWYAAPVGWMSADSAEFAVGIRSALVHGKELHLFGGAGIVAKSNADMEWEETGHKMENFTRILEEKIKMRDQSL